MTLFGIQFAHPEWMGLGLAWLVFVVLLILLERRGSEALDRWIGLAMQGRLLDRPSRWRRFARIGLIGASGALMSIALMQPQWGERFIATPRVGAEIMIALDVSRSMLADDAKPSRLERAKAEVRDLLAYLRDDYVGLIAFAGRASVLSPMTPDKSFLRLALDGAGPHSVSRGGTRLAEPILRAVAGFGDPGPAQRALILITDGEDHDSFALDAAKKAAEAGIKIIAIGFGDEAGSPIFVRDPRTGARVQVRDGAGQPVISRLDGEGLRELALATDGAFVPAGTGVLDLASIYDAHISGLTRGQLDERGRTIRDEIYQLFLAAALICLIAAVWVTAGRSRRTALGPQANLLLLGGAVTCALLTAPSPAVAQVSPTEDAAVSEREAESTASEGENPTSSPETDPRTLFNRANAALAAGDAEAATPLFRAARRDAADDPELRFAATYNLGWAAVARAKSAREDDPEAALAALYEAADWFREAASARPEADEPRHNLDVTLRQALALADEIAQAKSGSIEETLDALVLSQRERAASAAALLEEVTREGELAATDRLRPAFRDEATAQRLLLSETDALAERVARERDAIVSQSEESRSPEEALRAAQLEGVMIYLESAIDRMGQTRRQLRQRRAERAYRRSAGALGELKRARDQLRDPVQQIGVLLEETTRLAGATYALATKGRGLPEQNAGNPALGGGATPQVPAYLTPGALEEEARRLEGRVSELGGRLEQAASEASAAPAPDPSATAPGAPSPADLEALTTALVGAAPLVVQAGEAMAAATSAVGTEDLQNALEKEALAAERLAAAQEWFFDFRQLLDAALETEQRIASVAASEEPEIAAARAEYAPLFRDEQGTNLERAERLRPLLDRERASRLEEVAAAAAEEGGAEVLGPDGEAMDPVALEEERFAQAEQRLALADGAMQETAAGLGAEVDRPGASAVGAESALDWPGVGEAATRAVTHLEALRTLFFTLVEHVRALAQDQVDLNDETDAAATLASVEEGREEDAPRGPEAQRKGASLTAQQADLETRSGQLADALLAQAEALGAMPEAAAPPSGAAPGTVPPPDAPTSADPAAESERFRLAADQLALAQLSMGDAGQALSDATAALDTARPPQDLALEALAKALEILSPPPPPEPESDEENESPDSGDGESEPQESESEAGQDESDSASENAEMEEGEEENDPSQLLQGVRDREAERRRDQERERQQRRSQPVERDW